jgi:hypothetical protein
MHSRKHWAPGNGVKVLRVARAVAGSWTVQAAIADQGICPACGSRSRRRHGWPYRRLQDYPEHGESVAAELRIRRWRCSSQDCNRNTFSDQLPSVAIPYARRTSRTAQIASHLGHAAGGRPGERLMRRLGMPVSDDTTCASSSAMLPATDRQQESSVWMTGVGGERHYTVPSSLISSVSRLLTFWKTGVSRVQLNGCGTILPSRSSAETDAACMRRPSVKAPHTPGR